MEAKPKIPGRFQLEPRGQWLMEMGADPARRFCWWGLCCRFSWDLGASTAKVTAADVCRCLQMFADVLLAAVVELVTSEPQASAQPGKKTDAGSVPRLVPWGLQWGVPTGDMCPG